MNLDSRRIGTASASDRLVVLQLQGFIGQPGAFSFLGGYMPHKTVDLPGNQPETPSQPAGLVLSKEEWETVFSFWNRAGNLLHLVSDLAGGGDNAQLYNFVELLEEFWDPFSGVVFDISRGGRVPDEWDGAVIPKGGEE